MSNRVNVYLDEEYRQMLDTLSKITGMNQSQVIRAALNSYVETDTFKHHMANATAAALLKKLENLND